MSAATVLSPINFVEDFATADDFSKKHTPFIETCGDEDVHCIFIEVGHEIPHPNQLDHHIGWIEVYADDVPVARFDLTPVTTQPKVSMFLNVPTGTRIRAVEYCNLDGFWSYEITV